VSPVHDQDLKAANILVQTNGVCKISDFAISKHADNDGFVFTALQGSLFWMAPEVINTQKQGYNSKVDIWSLGCLVLEMWTGARPWAGFLARDVMVQVGCCCLNL
jgi:serine/threonine protein kinase